jgi:hypothetical protein
MSTYTHFVFQHLIEALPKVGDLVLAISHDGKHEMTVIESMSAFAPHLGIPGYAYVSLKTVARNDGLHWGDQSESERQLGWAIYPHAIPLTPPQD